MVLKKVPWFEKFSLIWAENLLFSPDFPDWKVFKNFPDFPDWWEVCRASSCLRARCAGKCLAFSWPTCTVPWGMEVPPPHSQATTLLLVNDGSILEYRKNGLFHKNNGLQTRTYTQVYIMSFTYPRWQHVDYCSRLLISTIFLPRQPQSSIEQQLFFGLLFSLTDDEKLCQNEVDGSWITTSQFHFIKASNDYSKVIKGFCTSWYKKRGQPIYN